MGLAISAMSLAEPAAAVLSAFSEARGESGEGVLRGFEQAHSPLAAIIHAIDR
jgi:hypothetical protein